MLLVEHYRIVFLGRDDHNMGHEKELEGLQSHDVNGCYEILGNFFSLVGRTGQEYPFLYFYFFFFFQNHGILRHQLS